jgi:ribosome-binding protein aMBF1 (putative translation factor)
MKPMDIEFLSEIAEEEKDIPIVCNSKNYAEEMSPLGALVWNARIHLKLGVEEFAEQCDIDAEDVERIEYDASYAPDMRTLHALSVFLKIKNDVLAKLA